MAEKTSRLDSALAAEERVLQLLQVQAEAVHVDTLITDSGLEPARILEVLTALELTGVVVRLPGMYFTSTPANRGRDEGNSVLFRNKKERQGQRKTSPTQRGDESRGTPNLQDYLRMFSDLNINKIRNHIRPHKPCLLLAVIDLVEAGVITDGRVRYVSTLESFSEYFEIVSTPTDRNRPYNPFYFLKSEPFWSMTVKDGQENAFAKIGQTPSHRQMEDYTDYAEIDPALFAHMQSAAGRDAMRAQLIRYFPEHQETLSRKIAIRQASNIYARALHEAAANLSAVHEAPPDSMVRDDAFRRLVLEAYDYRCAASGWRLIVPGSRILVQAAHLIPHSESQDDDPRNGIALTPNFHWAMDQHIIAPGPDMKWHLSKVVDKRIPDNQPLLELEGKAIIPPTKQSMLPRKDALEWRLERLLPAA